VEEEWFGLVVRFCMNRGFGIRSLFPRGEGLRAAVRGLRLLSDAWCEIKDVRD
jgi:hypothetical protein